MADNQNSPVLARAAKIYQQKVDRREVVCYYLACELPRVFKNISDSALEEIEASVNKLDDGELWRLLEALAFTYRSNSVFHAVSNMGLDWYEIEIGIKEITLGGVNPDVNKITFSDNIKRSAPLFAGYLQDYFARHVSEDPLKLKEFTPMSSIRHPRIMLWEREGKIVTLDGIHRLISQTMNGHQTVRAYLAVYNNNPPKIMLGSGSFILMRMLYSQYQKPEQRKHILEATRLMALASTDGEKAIKEQWINTRLSPELKKIGEELLKSIQK